MAAAPIRVISMPVTSITTVEPSRAEVFLNSAMFYGITTLLMFGPLALGVTEPWSVFVLQTGTVMLFLAWAIKQAVCGSVCVHWNPLFAPMLLFGVTLGVQLFLGTTVYRYETANLALQYIAYGALAFVAVQALDAFPAQAMFCRFLSMYGFALALFALIQSFSSNGKLYWLWASGTGGWIYGPYVNHNHYAGLMEMLAPIPLVLCLTDRASGAQKFLLGFASLMMAATIFLSGSRGGMIAFFVQSVLLFAFAWKRGKSPAAMLSVLSFVLLLGVLIAWLGWSTMAARWQEVRLAQGVEMPMGGRLAIDRDALRMFAERPFLGWGLGNFANVHPQFSSFFTDVYVNSVHNDYLQLLVETGALGGLAMLWFVFILFRQGARRLLAWNVCAEDSLAVAALVGCTGLLVHSLVDFNLRIPANAALFYVLAVSAAAGSSTRET